MLLFLFQSKFFLSNFMCRMHWGRRMIIVLFLVPSHMVWLHANVVYDIVCSLGMFLHLFIHFVWVHVWIWVPQPACGGQRNLGELLLFFGSVDPRHETQLSGLAGNALTSELSHQPVFRSSLHFVLTSVRILTMQDTWVLEICCDITVLVVKGSVFSIEGVVKVGGPRDSLVVRRAHCEDTKTVVTSWPH